MSGTAAREPKIVHLDAIQLRKDSVVICDQYGVFVDITYSHRPSAKTQPIVSCGPTWRDCELVIVDPVTLQESASSTIGEVWITGTTVALGYWKKSDDRTFGNTLPKKSGR